jgi:2-oxoglutarate ferredoxin oxidoreductase subunit alpha
MRSLLINELEVDPKKLVRILNFDGMPITAANICGQIMEKKLKD